MRFIDHAGLNRLSVLLQHLNLGDRILKGRLELFSTASKLPSERRLCDTLEKKLQSENYWKSNNSTGKMPPIDSKDVLINIISTMNQCFPDYEFSSLTPDKFYYEEDMNKVCSEINYKLSFIVERFKPGFMEQLWSTIKDAISLNEAEIYSYQAGIEADPYTDENSLYSFDYFFHDRRRQRILFFSCMTKSKLKSPSDAISDDEDVLSDAGEQILAYTRSTEEEDIELSELEQASQASNASVNVIHYLI